MYFSSSKPNPKSKNSSSRLPPPSLFQGPPSVNASNGSVATGLLPNPRVSTIASPGVTHGSQSIDGAASASAAAAGAGLVKGILPSVHSSDSAGRLSPFLLRSSQPQGDADGADLLWQEMQNALADVELRAAAGEHVFGDEHLKALDELRAKQLKLAQAWARSEVDDPIENKTAGESGPSATTATTAQSAAPAPKVGGDAFDAAATSNGIATYKALEAETEKDLQQARKRREANDRYFERVNNSVLDVVVKLDDVAQAMRAVEKESKDIWSDSASETLSTTATSANG